MPFGDKRSNVVERLIALKKKYPNFVVNGIKQLSLMKGNLGWHWQYSCTMSL